MNKLNLTITSELDNIKMVENFIEKTIEELKLSEELKGKITLSIMEAVNNSILYGNKQDPEKIIKITVVKSHKKIIFTVEDEGKGFDFNNIPDPTTPQHLKKVTGRGLYLMTRLTNKLLFTKNGAKVMMMFSLTDEAHG